MDFTRAVLVQSSHVFLGSIALVRGEPIHWPTLVRLVHDAVTSDLRYDARGRNTVHFAVAFDDELAFAVLRDALRRVQEVA